MNAKAEADALEDVRIKGDELKMPPLKAVTPEAAEEAAERLYSVVPPVRVTELITILAEATNMGLTRMAEASSLARYGSSRGPPAGTCARTPTGPRSAT